MEVFSGFLFTVLAANFEFAACHKQKYTAYDRFHGPNSLNGPYGKIPTKKEPIRMLGFTLPYNNVISCLDYYGKNGLAILSVVYSFGCEGRGRELKRESFNCTTHP